MAFWACILLAGASENICLRGALQMNIFLIDWLITAVDISFCTRLQNFIQIGPPSAEKNVEKDDGSQPSLILGVQ